MWKPIILIVAACIGLTLVPASLAQEVTPSGENEMTTTATQTGYAPVNGLNMYYEVHGTGEPLVILHGAYMTIPAMGDLIPRLAETRQVIALEAQGHGRTADIPDRPITYEQMAEDVAALLMFLNIPRADVLGYSMGGAIALQVARSHPEMVDKLVIMSGGFNAQGFQPGLLDMISSITAESFAGTPIETEYLRLSPHPEQFADFVHKMVVFDTQAEFNWSPESIRAIPSPALIVAGDSDAVTLEHTIELFRLFDGGGNADLAGPSESQLVVLPNTSHWGVGQSADVLVPMITAFLDAQPPQPPAQ